MARADCTERARTIMQLAMNVSSQEGITDLNSVVKRMQEIAPGNDLDRETVAQAIVDATEVGPNETNEIQDTVNRIKKEARENQRLESTISRFERILEEGSVPTTRKRAAAKASDAIVELRTVLKELKSEVAKSEPVRKAKLEKQINELQAIIAEGKFAPKVKPAETPISAELDNIIFKRDELRRTINQEINALKPQTVWNKTFDTLNVARSVMTSFDLSAVFRQGGFFVFGNPVLASKSIIPMLRAAASPKAEAKAFRNIQEEALWPMMRRTKLAIVEPGAQLKDREEVYQSTLIEKFSKIPVIGKVAAPILASERAYITFLNKLRADAFKAFAATLSPNGNLTLEEAQAISNFINAATGRGKLAIAGTNFENSAVALNALFFSPRLMASRFQMLGGLVAPGTFFKSGKGTTLKAAPKNVRKLIRRQYARYLVGMGLFYALATLAFDDDDEFDIEVDPRSSDFGKLRFGNTRIDPLSGMSQTIVLLARTMVTGEFKSSSSGNIRKLTGTDLPFGMGDGFTVATDFFRNKFSPLFGTFVDIRLKGRTFEGGPITAKHLAGRFLPMTFEEIRESIQEQGLSKGSAISLMAVFGMGVQTWGSAFNTMAIPELEQAFSDNVYKENGTVTRQGVKVKVKKGEPHLGEEGRITALREEFKKKGIKLVKRRDKKGKVLQGKGFKL